MCLQIKKKKTAEILFRYFSERQTEKSVQVISKLLNRGCCSKCIKHVFFYYLRGWSGGALVLGKLPVPGRPTNLHNSNARAYCTYSRCGWGLFGHFSLVYLFSLLSPSLWEAARYRLKYCLKGPLNLKQPTNYLLSTLLLMK